MLDKVVRFTVALVVGGMTVLSYVLAMLTVIAVFMGNMKDYEYFLAFLTLLGIGLYNLMLHELSIEDKGHL